MKQLNFFPYAVLLGACLAVAACTATDTRRSVGETVDDATLTARVKAELIGDDTAKARRIEVETYRGVVQLNGFVSSDEEKRAAEQAARKVEGVKNVQNNLQVKSELEDGQESRRMGETLDDAQVTARVKSALVGNPRTAARRINVTTYAGVVQLSGFVNSEEEKRAAGDAAREVQGVREVQNNLQVKPEAETEN